MTLLPLPVPVVELIGTTGAVLTTVCWLPQAVKIIRDRYTRALSPADKSCLHARGLAMAWLCPTGR